MILNTPFPDLPLLGRLDVVDVFAYHDGPRLFTARNAIGGLFLVEWAAEDLTGDTWLIAPLSLVRYRCLVSGGKSFRSIFTDSELGFIYNAHVPTSREGVSLTQMPSGAIPDDLLPAEDERVDEDEIRALAVTAPFVSLDAPRVAGLSLNLRLEPSSETAGVVSLPQLTVLFQRLQRLAKSVFLAMKSAGEIEGPLPKLAVAQTYAGSLGFIITTIAVRPATVRGTPALLRRVAKTVQTAISGGEAIPFNEQGHAVTDVLEWFAREDVQATLAVVSDTHSTESLTRITPSDMRGEIWHARVSLNRFAPPEPVVEVKRWVAEEELRVPPSMGDWVARGRFVQLDTLGQTYQFQTDRGAMLGGTIADSAMDAARHITFGLKYTVRLEFNDHVQAAEPSWLLVEIVPISLQLSSR